jgi:F0F1-type ATP synthase membrane subunit c/vacuolar-type H+-ATPase subunit K
MVAQGMVAKRSGVKRRGASGNSGYSLARWIVIAALAVGLGMIWAAYELGQSQAGHNRFSAQARERELRDQLIERQDVIEDLREQMALLETDARIKTESFAQLEQELLTQQAQIQSQSEDLAFYQGIVSVDEKEGLRVQDMVLAPGLTGGDFTLRLVLAQALRNDRKISGSLELVVEGQRAGNTESLQLAQLSPDGEQRLDFSFRYFQNLESELRVPDDFSPERVTVTLRPKGKNGKTVEQSFAWLVQAG